MLKDECVDLQDGAVLDDNDDDDGADLDHQIHHGLQSCGEEATIS